MHLMKMEKILQELGMDERKNNYTKSLSGVEGYV